MASIDLSIDHSIICHAWNKDRTQLAISANSNDVLIYGKNGPSGKWELQYTLTEHTSKCLSIDWAPNSNRILTCGADKNAYVWNFDGKQWKPDLVVLRINRAANCCKWSPNENKFAVGCGLKLICICYYERNQEFWVSKHIRKPLKSSVLCLDWHPNNVLLACGGADYKCRVYSTYIADADGAKPTQSQWGNNMDFAECLVEYGNQSSGWVYSLGFSMSGSRLVWVGHDSSIYLVDANRNPTEIIPLRTGFLPFLSIMFVTESTLVAVGHDCYPVVFSFDGSKISFVEKLNVSPTATTNLKSSMGAFQRFQNVDRMNVAESSTTTEQNTIHLNSIKQIIGFQGDARGFNKVSTCGIDGQVVLWDFKTLEGQFSALKIQ